ncbi:aspartate aminotransferase family protein [bacterium]|nr:aspartate aminotransferase family protein [bacterium]
MPVHTFMSAQEYAEYRPQALDMVRRHQNEQTADALEALDDELFECCGEGCYFYDVRGRRYFDATTGGGVFALGHANPDVVESVCAQARKGGLSSRVGFIPKQLELLKELSEIVPGNHTYGYIGSTGTEVIEAAMRLARLTTGRTKIVSMEFGYHGMSIATVSVTGVPYCHAGSPDELPDAELIPYNNLEAAARAITDDVAAVIIEPIQWAAGCRVASPEYLRGLRRLCTEHGSLLIFDEIQTGMGRTGQWFAAQRANVVPDIIICGKALSGGVAPIAAIMYSKRVHEAESKIPSFLNSTFAGNPLACSAALAAIKYIKDNNLLARINALSDLLVKHLDELCERYPDIVCRHDGLGLMRCAITTAPQYGIAMSAFLHLEHEVWLSALAYDPRCLRISPPYIASDADIEQLFAAISAVCQQMRTLGPQGVQQFLAEANAKIAAHNKSH